MPGAWRLSQRTEMLLLCQNQFTPGPNGKHATSPSSPASTHLLRTRTPLNGVRVRCQRMCVRARIRNRTHARTRSRRLLRVFVFELKFFQTWPSYYYYYATTASTAATAAATVWQERRQESERPLFINGLLLVICCVCVYANRA